MFHPAIDIVVLALSIVGHPQVDAMTPPRKQLPNPTEVSQSAPTIARLRYQTQKIIPTYNLSFPIILHNPRKCASFSVT